MSSSYVRYREGQVYAQMLIEQLENGNLTLSEGETIKIVGHSQGAAFAAGLASVLSKHQNIHHGLNPYFILHLTNRTVLSIRKE